MIALDSQFLGREARKVILFRGDDGSCLGAVPHDGGRFFFDPEGAKLAVVNRGGVSVWAIPATGGVEARTVP